MEKPASANRSGKSTPTKHKDNDAEEEEQKLLMEEQVKQRKAEEKKKLEQERLKALDSIRQKEDEETEEELNLINNTRLILKEKNRTNPEWERYLRCDGKPDPTSLTQINTFISVTMSKTNSDINVVIEEADLILTLLKELDQVLHDAEQTQTPEQATTYKETILALQKLLLVRYNDATLKLLQEATYEADSETGNLQKVVKGANEVLMLWGNLNKNPRFKSYQFENENLQFELPKVLAMADVAVRVLKTSFDHYSHRCSSFNPKMEKPIEVPEDVAVEEDSAQVEVVADNVDAPDKEDVESTATPNGRKSEMSVTSEKEEDDKDKKTEEGEDPTPVPDQEYKDADIELDEILDPDVVDLRQFHPLGGVYHIDLLEMPPQPKSVKGWTLTQITEKPLTSMKYPSDLPAKTRSRTPSAVGESREGGVTPTKTPVEQQPPIGISLHLPPDVMFLEEPQIAVWDKNDLHWKTRDVSELNFDEEKRALTFKTSSFGVFSLMQDAHLNMPFQSWELKSKSHDSSLLTITGAITEADIEIKGSKCCLIPSSEDPASELSHIHNQWITVEDLITAMKRSGVNLFPAEDSHKFVSIQPKSLNLESIYKQMSLLSSSYAFSWSKWNNDAPKDSVIFQVAPFISSKSSSDPPTVPDDAWSSFIASDDRCYKIQATEFDDVFSDEIAADSQYHCDVLHAVRSSNQSSSQAKSLDAIHVDTVTQLLTSSKIITFS